MHGLEMLARQAAETPPPPKKAHDGVLFPTLAHLKPYICCIADDGGKSEHRFTVVFGDGDYFTFNNAIHDGQWHKALGSGRLDKGREVVNAARAGKLQLIRWIDLPNDAQSDLRDLVNSMWQRVYDYHEDAWLRDRTETEADSIHFTRCRPEYMPIYGDGCDRLGRNNFAIKSSYDDEGDRMDLTWGDALRRIIPSSKTFNLLFRDKMSGVNTWDTKERL